jgi:P22 coat protein - gene protein 5
MAAITSTNVANAIVKLVAADALPVLVGNLVMGNLVNRDYEPVLAQAGDTINIPIPPTMVANNIAEGGTVQTQNPSLGNAQIVLNTHAEATFQIPDVTKVLAVPDLLKIYMEPAVAAIAQKIESDLLGLYPGFTANDAVGTPGTAITEATIDRAEVHGCGRQYLFGLAADSAVQRIPDRRRCGSADAGGRHGRQSEGLLRIPVAVRREDRQQPGNNA